MKNFFNGAARFAIGFPLLVGAIIFSGVRATIGIGVNAIKTICGVGATLGALCTHALDFARVKIIRGFNSAIGRVTEDPANTDRTKKLFEACWTYTKSRYEACGLVGYEKVFSGKQDDKYKNQLSKFFTKSEVKQSFNEISQDTDSLLNKGMQKKKSFAELIKEIPNTSDVIAKATQLTMGMDKKERKNADDKRKIKSYSK